MSAQPSGVALSGSGDTRARRASQSRSERLIAAGRVVLASSSLFAVWLDPTEPAKYADVAYTLLVTYLVYAAAIALLVWRREGAAIRPQGTVSHVLDLAFFSLFIYFTAGPASPFNAYFVFSLVCASLRWGWTGVLWTATAALGAFVGVGLAFAEQGPFELHGLIIRGVYLVVVAVLLGYLGAHEQRTRREISLLAGWPRPRPDDLDPLLAEMLAHAARILRAPRLLLLWAESEEPWQHLACWEGGRMRRERESPAAFEPSVDRRLAEAAFLSPDASADQPRVLHLDSAGASWSRFAPIHHDLVRRFSIGAVVSNRLRGEEAEGRLFFLDRSKLTADELVLGEVVASVFAAQLDHFYLAGRLREAAAANERVRLSRDLHDGVLQSLTGIGLRLAAVLRLLDDDPAAVRDRLVQIQGQIAAVQRDLRFFIEELNQPAALADGRPPLHHRIEELVARLEQEWELRVELETPLPDSEAPAGLDRDVYNLVREALVNAARHGEAKSARVRIVSQAETVSIVVVDNGRGFPFSGRFTAAQLASHGGGPRSLRERVLARGGSLVLETGSGGTRLEIELPIPAG
jgi:signal transduction histidine kinase